MDIKKNDPAEELRVLIEEWGYLNSEKTEIEKFNDILKNKYCFAIVLIVFKNKK